MRFTLFSIILFTWALWIGGTIATFVFASHIFAHQPRALASVAASDMFVIFGKYQLYLAGIALAACGMLLTTFPSKPAILLLGAVLAAGGLATIGGLGITPQMEMMREQNRAHSEQFAHLHRRSMIVMTTESVFLLLVGGLLLLTIEKSPRQMELNGPDGALP